MQEKSSGQILRNKLKQPYIVNQTILITKKRIKIEGGNIRKYIRQMIQQKLP